jgi:hypothetical protein
MPFVRCLLVATCDVCVLADHLQQPCCAQCFAKALLDGNLVELLRVRGRCAEHVRSGAWRGGFGREGRSWRAHDIIIGSCCCCAVCLCFCGLLCAWRRALSCFLFSFFVLCRVLCRVLRRVLGGAVVGRALAGETRAEFIRLASGFFAFGALLGEFGLGLLHLALVFALAFELVKKMTVCLVGRARGG